MKLRILIFLFLFSQGYAGKKAWNYDQVCKQERNQRKCELYALYKVEVGRVKVSLADCQEDSLICNKARVYRDCLCKVDLLTALVRQEQELFYEYLSELYDKPNPILSYYRTLLDLRNKITSFLKEQCINITSELSSFTNEFIASQPISDADLEMVTDYETSDEHDGDNDWNPYDSQAGAGLPRSPTPFPPPPPRPPLPEDGFH